MRDVTSTPTTRGRMRFSLGLSIGTGWPTDPPKTSTFRRIITQRGWEKLKIIFLRDQRRARKAVATSCLSETCFRPLECAGAFADLQPLDLQEMASIGHTHKNDEFEKWPNRSNNFFCATRRLGRYHSLSLMFSVTGSVS